MNSSEGAGWIAVVGWDRFQHYKDRDVLWVKNYTRLMNDDDYLALTPHCALILHRLWLVYASSSCRLPADTGSLSRRLALRVTKSHLESLNHAGFIRIVASKSLASRYHGASAHVFAERREETNYEAVNKGRDVRPVDLDEAKPSENGQLDRVLPLPVDEELEQLKSRIGREIP